MSTSTLSLTNDFQDISERIHQLSSIPYIKQYVDYPGLAENRLALLLIYFSEMGFSKERAKNLCVATGLVQLGLDTHELVKNKYDNSLSSSRNRQLSVLLGDFFSSLYFRTLADSNELQAIQILANATERVNEAKMSLYVLEKDNKLTWDNYLTHRKAIDSTLYTNFVAAFSKTPELAAVWKSLFEQTSVVDCMIDEWEQMQWQQQIPFGLSRFLPLKDSTITQVIAGVEAKAIELLGVCDQLVRNFCSIEIQNAISWITSRYSHRMNRLKRLVEEM